MLPLCLAEKIHREKRRFAVVYNESIHGSGEYSVRDNRLHREESIARMTGKGRPAIVHGGKEGKHIIRLGACPLRNAFCASIFQFLSRPGEKNWRQFQRRGTRRTLCSRVIRADWNDSQVRTTTAEYARVDRTACSTSIEKDNTFKARSPSIKITGERVLCHTRTNVSIHRWGREVAVSSGHDKSTGYDREIAIETNRNES